MPNYEHSGLETKVKGHKRIGHEEDEKTYDSRGEGRQAMLLIRNNVRFTPHQEYDVIDRNGNHRTYEVDFDLHRPHKFKGISYPVSALEYKGVFNERAKERMDW